MTTNERRYLQMLLRDLPNRELEASGWILEKRCSDTSIYLQWMRDGKWDWIQDDNNKILELRVNLTNRERRGQ